MLFSGLVLAKASGRAERFSGFVVWWFFSRADARDTGAALLIRGGRAPGVETPAHEEGREAGWEERWAGAGR